MRQITLDSGLTLDIKEQNFDDMELIDLLVDVDQGDPVAVTKAATKMLGSDQKKLLYDSLRNGEGRVPASDFAKAITEIFEKLGEEGKN